MKANSEKGFSLLEMLISVVILLIVSGAALYALTYYQRSYGSTQLRADMHMGVRAALELMAQEVNQAGLLPFGPPRQLSAAVSACPSPCSTPPPVQVTAGGVPNVSSIFVNEKLTIDTGSNQEDVTVTGVNTATSQITAVFTKAHPANAPVNAFGLFPQGIRSTSPNVSSSTLLKIFGDINGDNTLTYVEYDCSGSTLTRTEWQIPSSGGARVFVRTGVLVKDVIPTPCFQYTTASAAGFNFVTSVTVTLSVQTADKDPFTKQRVSMTKSSLNLSPRNLLTGLDLAQAGFTGRLQPIPPLSPPL
jgi:prepilin-type N-terminal cleavage/methylation domain-containing protein